jgi:hypothetical protein
MKDSHLSRGAPDHEMQLVRAFFREIKGYCDRIAAAGSSDTSPNA